MVKMLKHHVSCLFFHLCRSDPVDQSALTSSRSSPHAPPPQAVWGGSPSLTISPGTEAVPASLSFKLKSESEKTAASFSSSAVTFFDPGNVHFE